MLRKITKSAKDFIYLSFVQQIQNIKQKKRRVYSINHYKHFLLRSFLSLLDEENNPVFRYKVP